MQWYSHLYVGRRAKRHRYAIIQGIREEKLQPGVYVITSPQNGENICDIYPSALLLVPSEKKKERMILRLPDSNTRNLFVAHLESSNMSISDFNVVLEIDNMATIKDLIRRDFGVSILARSGCLDELKKGKITVLPVENLSMMREINIAYHNDFTQFDVLHDIMKVYNETLRIYA